MRLALEIPRNLAAREGISCYTCAEMRRGERASKGQCVGRVPGACWVEAAGKGHGRPVLEEETQARAGPA